MARSRERKINLPAPYLRRVWLDWERVPERDAYPFNIPLIKGGLDLTFKSPVTILVGENGVGKSTIIEGIASLAGYDDAGGGKGYRPVDHSLSIEKSGGTLAHGLRASWLPKITDGWFFKAETFFSVARYLDAAAREPFGGPPPDFLSHSHGEGFLRFFEERTHRQGVYFFDEPESALSLVRQIQFLKVLSRMDTSGVCQVIMATHSPLLMAYPGATLLRLSNAGIDPLKLEETDHFRLLRDFCRDPRAFVEEAIKS